MGKNNLFYGIRDVSCPRRYETGKILCSGNDLKKRIVSVKLDDGASLGSTGNVLYRRSGFILNELARLQFTHDTSEVLEVYFDEESTYGDYVWAINNAYIFSYRRFVYLDNSLYFWANPAPPRIEETLDLLIPQPGNIILPPSPPRSEPTQFELFARSVRWGWGSITAMIRQNYLLTAGLIVLILIPGVWSIIRRWEKEGIPA